MYSAYEYTVPPYGSTTIFTDLQIKLPEGCYGRVAPRSGISREYNLGVGGGVIDRDYRGNVGVLLFNHGPQPFEVFRGSRIAQLICERVAYPLIQEVEKLTQNDSERGINGFGSTGGYVVSTTGIESPDQSPLQ